MKKADYLFFIGRTIFLLVISTSYGFFLISAYLESGSSGKIVEFHRK